MGGRGEAGDGAPAETPEEKGGCNGGRILLSWKRNCFFYLLLFFIIIVIVIIIIVIVIVINGDCFKVGFLAFITLLLFFLCFEIRYFRNIKMSYGNFGSFSFAKRSPF